MASPDPTRSPARASFSAARHSVSSARDSFNNDLAAIHRELIAENELMLSEIEDLRAQVDLGEAQRRELRDLQGAHTALTQELAGFLTRISAPSLSAVEKRLAVAERNAVELRMEVERLQRANDEMSSVLTSVEEEQGEAAREAEQTQTALQQLDSFWRFMKLEGPCISAAHNSLDDFMKRMDEHRNIIASTRDAAQQKIRRLCSDSRASSLAGTAAPEVALRCPASCSRSCSVDSVATDDTQGSMCWQTPRPGQCNNLTTSSALDLSRAPLRSTSAELLVFGCEVLLSMMDLCSSVNAMLTPSSCAVDLR